MRNFPKSAILAFALAVVLAAPIPAQEVRRPTVVEMMGLRSWTPKMVEDSVARFAPGVSLADHACAVILRDSVGFADAASIQLLQGDTMWVLLPLVEPELRDRVRFRVHTDAKPPVAEWAGLFRALEEDRHLLNHLQHPAVLLAGTDTAFGQAVPSSVLRFRAALRRHDTPHDWDLARTTILTDSTITNRVVAALVLSNFAQRDSAYHLLAEGLRTTDMGSQASGLVLSALVRHQPRVVEWAPARDALDALMGGTNLFAYTEILEVLAGTRVTPALGRELARRNPDLLLDHLGARNPMTPEPAHRFLVSVSGRDFGRDTAAWGHWLTESPR